MRRCFCVMSAARFAAVLAVLAMIAPAGGAAENDEERLSLKKEIEADWLLQLARAANAFGLSKGQEAAFGCDGVKDGDTGFHTGCQENPWWQVDLDKPQPISRIVVYKHQRPRAEPSTEAAAARQEQRRRGGQRAGGLEAAHAAGVCKAGDDPEGGESLTNH